MALMIAVVSQAGAGRAQSYDDGGRAFHSRCLSFLYLAADGQPRAIAPNFRSVVGSGASATAFESYSSALKKYKANWVDKTLDAFLTSPAWMEPGTGMVALAIDADQRQAIVRYLARIK